MPVERTCHLCSSPIREGVAYTRTGALDEGHRRLYVHAECYFEHVPEDRRDDYWRELSSQLAQGSSLGTGASVTTQSSARARTDGGSEPKRPTAIEVDGLAKTYPDGTQAVRSVSFTVQEGEVFGVLGPNGAGKSTLIGMLGTLVEPSQGQGTVAGVDVREDPDQLKPRLGFAMQDVGVDELATGREFLHLQGRLYGLSKQQTRERSDELLAIFDLEDAADRRIESYSGGMQRRVDLAGALIHEPEIVFLDEPTEGLDPRGRREMWHLLEDLNERLGATILLSTHYMEEADALCDRLAIMDEGRIVARGRPEELKATVGPASIQLRWTPERTPEALDEARELIQSRGVAERLQRSGDQLYVYVHDPPRAIPGLLRRLGAADLAPDSLSVEEASLDDVYLAYTGRSLEQAEQAQEGSG